MKISRLLTLTIAGLLFASCATGPSSNSTAVPKYGTKMSVVEKNWGQPDETMAYQDYRAKGYSSVASVGGSWSPQGGSVSGFAAGETYTPTTIVSIYKDRGWALFFEKRGLFFDERRTLIMVWRLVGWQKLEKDSSSAK